MILFALIFHSGDKPAIVIGVDTSVAIARQIVLNSPITDLIRGDPSILQFVEVLSVCDGASFDPKNILPVDVGFRQLTCGQPIYLGHSATINTTVIWPGRRMTREMTHEFRNCYFVLHGRGGRI